MKALILNSGLGRRMGDLTADHPKCMTPLATGETILSRQLSQLEKNGVTDILITTGPFVETLEAHARESVKKATLTFVNNLEYAATNYIYSIYLARNKLEDDIVLLHGDLVFSDEVFQGLLAQKGNAMAVSSTLPLPQKDFKAVIKDGEVQKVGVNFFEDALAAQPLYKLGKKCWMRWLSEIVRFVRNGERGCYAENALNELGGACHIGAYDVKDALCTEIDDPQDLQRVNGLLETS